MCRRRISDKDYQKDVKSLEVFLSGKQDKALDSLKEKVDEALCTSL